MPTKLCHYCDDPARWEAEYSFGVVIRACDEHKADLDELDQYPDYFKVRPHRIS